MTHRQMYIGIAGVLLAGLGLAALLYPVYLSHYDMYGIRINCGNGFNSEIGQAAETHGQEFVAQCGNAVLVRRLWAIPVVAIGWMLVTGFLVMWVHNYHEPTEPAHYVPHPEIARHP